MKILKVYNNNVVLASDGKAEMVVIGSGVGFCKKTNDLVDEGKIEKTYLFEDNQRKQLHQLLDRVPVLYFKIAEAIAAKASRELEIQLSNQILISLSDHIYFAVERTKKGTQIPNFMLNEIKALYEPQYRIGLWALQLIKANTGISLDEHEAGYIAIHIANATLGGSNENNSVNKILHFIKETQRIVEKEYQITLDNNELNTSRFVTHLKFLGQHFYKRQDRVSENLSDLYDYFVKLDPRLESCVNQISVYVKIVFNYDLEQYEKVYMMIHINKVVH